MNSQTDAWCIMMGEMALLFYKRAQKGGYARSARTTGYPGV